MLEKIGLPPKPSLRGNTWVVDASHCQSCSSQFTFLNRKHHCRRCGGIFCNNCTQNRMVLRGQGDSPVRVCEACKQQEEAARFEMRYGHKNRARKGTSKSASRSVDEVLNDILVNNGKEKATQDDDVDMLAGASDGANSEVDSLTPEELRQQSLEEKNRYKILKGEGKSAEALKAFKRSRELEREAAALELQLRKNRKKALTSRSSAEIQKDHETSELSTRGKPLKVKEKDDLTAELKELGWSETDIQNADKKPAATTVEGELLSLLQDSSQISSSKKSSGLDKSEVIALKKNALMFKREGKLAEAKEELKRAKILEKQLEEQELLAEAEDSEDELSALMRSLDKDEKNDFSSGFDLDSTLDFDNFSALGSDLDFDGNFEATDDDLHDPEMAAALQSLGWTDEPYHFDENVHQSSSVDRVALSDEILRLKKEAVTQKRSGNMAEAMSLLKRAKALEKDLEKLEEKELESSGLRSRTSDMISSTERKSPAKSKIMIQKELLALKKKALALRREGKLEEAENELKKGKALEEQLEEIGNPTKMDTKLSVGNVSDPLVEDLDLSSVLTPEDVQGDVTDQDLNDPAYISLLENLGWKDEDDPSVMNSSDVPNRKDRDTTTIIGESTVRKRKRTKAEIQRELLGLKRKALALRRQGQEIEADEVLANAKILEEEMAELEAPKVEVPTNFKEPKVEIAASMQDSMPMEPMNRECQQTPLKRPAEANDASEKRQVIHTTVATTQYNPTEVGPKVIDGANSSPNVSPDKQKSPVRQEILSHKRKALALKKEGKLAEAKEELRKAKLLEKSMEDPTHISPVEVSSSSTVIEEHGTLTFEERDPPHVAPTKLMSSSERLKLQRECLSHKRNAMKLRREGRTEEADAQLELAKKLEAQLEEVSPPNPIVPTTSESPDDSLVEDLFDPQLLSALKAIGLHDVNVNAHTPVKEEPRKSSSIVNETTNQERIHLEAQIKSEKVKALTLKRAGKQAEALEALRKAKQMEKKLTSMAA